MPIRNGRLYVDTSKTPNVGISIKEIARCIGVGSGDLGTLAKHKNNNMWSRKKPVERNEVDVNYEGIDWWKGFEGNCGVAAPTRVSSFSALLAQYDGRLNGWVHVPPQTHFRQEDYNGYYHYAKAPITGIDSQSQYFKINDSEVQVSISYNGDDVDENGSGSLKMSDFIIDNLSLDKWYVGVVIMDESGSDWIGFVANQQGADIETITFPMNMLVVGKTYMAVPFYSKTAFDVSYADGDKTIMSIPVVQPVKFKVAEPSALLFIGADAQWSSDKSRIDFTVEIVNRGTGSRNVDVATARLMVERADLSTPDGYWALNLDATTDYDIDLGITSIPKDGLTVTKSQSIPQGNRNKTYVLLVRIVGAGINFDFGPEYVLYEDELS